MLTSDAVQLKFIQLGLAVTQLSSVGFEALLPAIQVSLALAQQALVLPYEGLATCLFLDPFLAFCKSTLFMSTYSLVSPIRVHTCLFGYRNIKDLGFLVSNYLRHAWQSRVVMSASPDRLQNMPTFCQLSLTRCQVVLLML